MNWVHVVLLEKILFLILYNHLLIMTGNTERIIWIGTSNIVLPGNKSTFPGSSR